MTTYNINQIIAAVGGTRPWYDYWNSLAQIVKENQDEIGNLTVGAAPGFAAAYDTRFFITESGFSSDAYTAVLNPVATGEALPAGYRMYFLPSTSNTGAATLNVSSTDGAVGIRKIDRSGTPAKAALAANDLYAGIPCLMVFDGTHWVLVSDLPAPPAAAPPATTRTVITASGTWNRPSGCRAVLVQVWGGGGGGGASNGSGTSGSGGGAGYSESMIDVTSIASATVTIGSAGSGGSGTTGNGGSGGNSSWSDGVNTLTANGGSGGQSYSNGFDHGAGGSASGGQRNFAGTKGYTTQGGTGTGASGGTFSHPVTQRSDAAPVTAHFPGSGGTSRNSSGTGAAGFRGEIIVTEFY